MPRTNDAPLVVLTLRVPAEHADAVRAYARKVEDDTHLRVTPSAAGAAILEVGLVSLGLIPAPKSAASAKRGGKARASKP